MWFWISLLLLAEREEKEYPRPKQKPQKPATSGELVGGITAGCLIIALTTFCFSRCATVPDVAICTEINMTKGWCTKTVSNEEFFIDDEHPYAFEEGAKPMTWWEIRPFMVLAPIPSWKEIKVYIIDTCKQNNNCSTYISGWDRKIKDFDSTLPKKP